MTTEEQNGLLRCVTDICCIDREPQKCIRVSAADLVVNWHPVTSQAFVIEQKLLSKEFEAYLPRGYAVDDVTPQRNAPLTKARGTVRH